MFFAIAGEYRNITCTEGVDVAVGAVDFNHIPWLDGTVRQEDHATQQVGHNFLQTETETQAHRAPEYRQHGEIHAHRLDANEKGDGDKKDTHNFGRQHPCGWSQAS